MRIMFGWLTPEGEWTYTPPPQPAAPGATTPAPKPKKIWRPQGCFLQPPMPPRERQSRADGTRTWLFCLLHAGPRPAVEVLQRARAEGIALRGLHRAKRHCGVESVRVGGLAWRGKWVWQFPQPQL